MKVTSAIVDKSGRVVLESADLTGPGAGELLLEAVFSSLSPGTESALLAGKIHALPQEIGYSLVATVRDVGQGVTDFRPGDHVVATAKHASLQVVDERLVTPVPEGTDLEQAAFFNLAHTALYGIRRSGLKLGEPVLVMGQGLVGALTAQLARIAGAVPVIVTDIDDTRLQKARELGVHHAINPVSHPEELANIVATLDIGGIPVVFEATGRLEPLQQAAELVSERGRIVMLSTVHGESLPAIGDQLFMKGATLTGAYVNSKPFSLKRSDLTIADKWPPSLAEGTTRYANADTWSSDDDIRAILALIRYGTLDLRPLISHRFPVDQIPEAYDLVRKGDPSLLGGIIDWQSA